jgi:hypothetical protein
MSTTGTGRAKETLVRSEVGGSLRFTEVGPKRVGYGLPCVNCGTYYAADQSVCPICKCPERVSPSVVPIAVNVVTETVPDLAHLDEEREQFLKEYKAQMFSAHTQIDPAASFCCSLQESHDETYEPASICKDCYDKAQQRADLVEASLHIDLKEAAQIVYDAVWSDPSDPTKTYQNAAQALLTELRRRAGIDRVLTTLQPYTH